MSSIAKLLVFVRQHDDQVLPHRSDLRKQFDRLDAEAFAACTREGWALPDRETDTDRALTTIGVTNVPAHPTDAEGCGYRIMLADRTGERWLNHMTGLASIKPEASKPKGTAGRNTKEHPTVNQRMLDKIQKQSDSRAWSSPQWAESLDCSTSTVVATNTWKHLASLRATAKAET